MYFIYIILWADISSSPKTLWSEVELSTATWPCRAGSKQIPWFSDMDTHLTF